MLEAREAVARYATRLGALTGSQEVLITPGASEATALALTALLNSRHRLSSSIRFLTIKIHLLAKPWLCSSYDIE
jgi:hypothetical protein